MACMSEFKEGQKIYWIERPQYGETNHHFGFIVKFCQNHVKIRQVREQKHKIKHTEEYGIKPKWDETQYDNVKLKFNVIQFFDSKKIFKNT